MTLGKYPCLYSIIYYDDVDDVLSEAKGLIYADSMTHASEILEDYYGNIEEIHVKMFESGLVEFDNDTYEIVKKYMEES